MLNLSHRKEVNRDEKDPQQFGPGQRGCLLGEHQEDHAPESRQVMPQVKGVKATGLMVAGAATASRADMVAAISALFI